MLFACIQLSLLKVSEDQNNLILIEDGKVNLILLIEWPYESNQCLRQKIQAIYLSDVFPIPLIFSLDCNCKHLWPPADPRHCPDTAGDCV